MPEYIVEYRERKTSFGWRPSAITPILAMDIHEAAAKVARDRTQDHGDLFYRVRPKAHEEPLYLGYEAPEPAKEWKIIDNPDPARATT